MHLRAISIGYAVPRINFDAAVHSVFHSAVNLRPVGEDKLITLLASDEGDLPQGILTDAPKGFSFEGLPVGVRGTCRDGVLNLGDSLSIDLREARRWECHLQSFDADMTNGAVATAWRTAWEALNARQVIYGAEIVAEDLMTGLSLSRSPKSPDFGLPGRRSRRNSATKKQSALFQQMKKSVGKLFDMTRQCELDDENAIRAMIGLGTGLTPSGDDLLTGYMAGLWCAARGKPERLDFLSAFTETVVRLSNGTNDISRTYLYHAAHGHVSSRLVNQARAICNGLDSRQVQECTESAMQLGHSSGMDAVTGLLVGLVA